MIDEEATHEEFGYYSTDLKPKSNKKVVAVCDDCGNVRPIKKADYRALCRSCAAKRLTGENRPNWRGGKVKVECDNCGEIIGRSQSSIRGAKHHFCNHKCMAEWRSGGIKLICDNCGNDIEKVHCKIHGYEHHFCNRKCMGKWKSKHHRGENSPAWQGGISYKPYCQKFNEEFKEYVRDKFGRVCFLCPKTEEENGRHLSVHHVNYNKGCGCDDDETCQFVPLCVGCNTKVNFNRDMWEKKIKDKMQNKLNGWYI